jgi:hypothetical protein
VFRELASRLTAAHDGATVTNVSRLGVLTLAAVNALALPACDGSPAAPGGPAIVTIDTLGTAAIPPECCERGLPFSYRTLLTVRETGGAAVTITQLTLRVTELSGATTIRELSATEAFGTARVGGGGTLAGTVTFAAPLLTVGEMALAIAFRDEGGQTGSAQASTALRLDLTGTWAGPLPIRTEPTADWSDARLSLVQTGDTLTGDVVSRDGVSFPVAGSLSIEQTPFVTVRGLPGTSTCAGVIIVLRQFEFADGRIRRTSGHASGRCFGTVAGTFDLQRAT